MKILFMPNWKVYKCKTTPNNMQPPDYYISNRSYWFFKNISNVEVDIADIKSLKHIENYERKWLHFYVLQTIKVLFSIPKYDLVLSHGMQSGILLALIRKLIKWPRTPHIVFDIGSFNSAKDSGLKLKLMQLASKSIDGVIYHTSEQKMYYEKYYPWLLNKTRFIPFGTDIGKTKKTVKVIKKNKSKPYIICIGSIKRDWNTLISAYSLISSDVKLKIVGNTDLKREDKRIDIISRVEIDHLMELIKEARFCVLPLKWFNYSYGQMTLLQQMALGKAVIVANVPSVKDYVKDGKTALLYEAENIYDLKKKIEYCLNKTKIINEIGKKASLSVRKTYNEENMAKMVEKYIKENVK